MYIKCNYELRFRQIYKEIDMSLSCIYKDIQNYIDSFEKELTGRRNIPFEKVLYRFEGDEPTKKFYDDSSWQETRLPHDYAIAQGFDKNNITGGSGGYVVSGKLWYRIYPGKLDSSLRYTLDFDGAGGAVKLFVNDRYIGEHPNGTTPFWFDLTPYFDYDGHDVITILCDTTLQPYSRFYGGLGLVRRLRLIENGRMHLIPGSLHARVTDIGETAEIEVHSQVSYLRNEGYARIDRFEGESNRSATFTIKTEIIDSDGNVAAESVIPMCLVHCTGRYDKVQNLTIKAPKLWSPENPNLYKVHTRIYAVGMLMDEEIIPLGIRKLEKDPVKGLFVNGRFEKFKGVCLHQDSGYYGAAVPAKEWVRRLVTLKGMGCNAIRTAHHPFHDEFYAVCDYLGLYVMDEAFDEWHRGWPRNYTDSPYGKNTYGYYLYFDQWAKTDVELEIKRARRHPSVVMFSMGNEIPDFYYDDSPEVYNELKAVVKKLAPSLWVTEGSEGQCNLPLNEDMLACSDIVGINYSDLRYHEQFYRPIHAKHPDWVMVGSENSHQGQHWKEIEKQNYATGIFIWTGMDYLGESGGFESPVNYAEDFPLEAYSHGSFSGKLDITVQPRDQFYFHKSLWTEEPMIHASVLVNEYYPWHFYSKMETVPHWNWKNGETITLYIMTNCDEAAIVLNGKEIDRKKRDSDSGMPVEFKLKYAPGELKAVGYNGGKEVCTDILKTYKEAAKLVLTADSECISPEGDFANIQIELQDEDGTRVWASDRKVTLEVEGAEIFAMNSANLADPSMQHGADSYYLYRGRAQAAIVSGKEGTIRVKASCPGAEDAVIEINCAE